MAEGNIINRLINMFRDDEGLFQGGQYGRVGGRILDAMESTVPTGREEELVGRQLGKAFYVPQEEKFPGVKDITSPFAEDDPRMTKDFSMARILALDFDPNDASEIERLQNRLNLAGYKGKDGKKLSVDGKFGQNTLHALRNIQKDMGVEDPTAISAG